MSEPVFTVANQLTLLRMALVPALVVLALSKRFDWACGVFALAGVTDLLDGLIARLGQQQTTLGAVLDPVADKLLLASSFVVLTWGPGLSCPMPVWLSVVVLSRDLIILASVAVINFTLGRRVFYPSLLGKITTLAQLLTAGLALLSDAMGACVPGLLWLFDLTLALTVTSALHYVYLASVRKKVAA
jgi:cardiolipin synthase (CMP-forming)